MQAVPRLILKASSSEKVVFYVKASNEGVLLVEWVCFKLASQQSDALVPRVLHRIKFVAQGPRLNNTKAEKEGQVYASDKRLEIRVATKMLKLKVLFHDLPEFLLNGEIRKVSVQVINKNSLVAMTSIMVASNDPLHVFMDLSRVARNDDSVALYRWDCSSDKQVNMYNSVAPSPPDSTLSSATRIRRWKPGIETGNSFYNLSVGVILLELSTFTIGTGSWAIVPRYSCLRRWTLKRS